MLLIGITVLVLAIFIAAVLIPARRYRRLTRTPGYITHPKGQRRLP